MKEAVLLNTKQVRDMGRAFTGVAAQWTDKTSERNEARRSVVWNLWNTRDADALVAHFKAQGVINEITRTGVDADYGSRTSGGEYVRVKALIA
jgi:hypothetical protein